LELGISMVRPRFEQAGSDSMSTYDFLIHGDAVDQDRVSQWSFEYAKVADTSSFRGAINGDVNFAISSLNGNY
jgi:hypothetical protein